VTNRKPWRWLLAGVACIAATVLSAQTNVASGELYGVVSDSGGGIIAGASVTIESAATGTKRSTVTSSTGEYRFLVVPPGTYEIRVEKPSFRASIQRGVAIVIGQVTTLRSRLELGDLRQILVVEASATVVDPQRSNPSNALSDTWIHQLPIDRRDYLTFALLAPGVTDAKALADNTDLRIKQTPTSGISFFGSNGRGNTVTVDGGEMNDGGGGVRSTVGQEAVQEFQINRANYSAAIGAASGGAINIVSKAGTNDLHGSAFWYTRHDALDAGDPFARTLSGGSVTRIKPPSKRQQFGGTLGGPLRKNRTFLFASFEGLVRRESSVVSILTDESIFGPTPEQEAFLRLLPAANAAGLRALLTSPPSTVALFRNNSGVFPFSTDAYKSSLRLDHARAKGDRFFGRIDVNPFDESNANLQALVGASRGLETHNFDPTVLLAWTKASAAAFTNELRLQASYRHFTMKTRENFGPELRIAGYGVFNRDIFLPSRNIERRYEIKDDVSLLLGHHILKFGGQTWIRGILADSDVFFPGRFTFGALPAALLDPGLPFTLTALQTFNLGLPQTFIIGQGASELSAVYPYYSAYVQDSWRAASTLTIDIGLRYEVDVRKAPLRTDKNNVGPRLSFAWNPDGVGRTVLRGGYGIFYGLGNFGVDYTVNALNVIDGHRQIAQAFSSILVPGPASAVNIFSTLRAQGVIGIPTPSRSITPADLAQFGLSFSHTGPLPPFTVLFQPSADFASPYTQQASLGLERSIGQDFSIEVGGIFARSLKLPRARDANLLKAPIDPVLGIPVWSSPASFVDPLLAERNIFESTARAWYSALTVELRKRFSKTLSFGGNYTFSRAIDEALDYNYEFEGFDQTNLRAERALSSFHQKHRMTAYGLWRLPRGIQSAWILRANSGRPFNLLAGFDLNEDRNDLGDRPRFAGRNTGIGPAYWAADLRFSKNIATAEHASLEITAEAFNLFNHLNYSSVNNVVGDMPGPFHVTGRDDRLPSQPLGFTSAYDTRKVQLGLRYSF
jgi:hypothetical protein